MARLLSTAALCVLIHAALSGGVVVDEDFAVVDPSESWVFNTNDPAHPVAWEPGDGRVRLVAEGDLWRAASMILVMETGFQVYDFEAEFRFEIEPADPDWTHADGMVFFVGAVGHGYLGNSGSGIGWGGPGNVFPSIAIEIDTWRDGDEDCEGWSENHIGVAYLPNGNGDNAPRSAYLANPMDFGFPDFEGGGSFTARLQFACGDFTLSLSHPTVVDELGNPRWVQVLSGHFPFFQSFRGRPGFSSGTGAAASGVYLRSARIVTPESSGCRERGITLPIRINAGGTTYVDPRGNRWDTDMLLGPSSPLGNRVGGVYLGSSRVPIDRTDADRLYASERWGDSTWTFPVPNGWYTVVLHFAELWTPGNRRKFQVGIEGIDPILADFSPVRAAGGRFAACQRTFLANVIDGNGLTVHLSGNPASPDPNPKISAIEIHAGQLPQEVLPVADAGLWAGHRIVSNGPGAIDTNGFVKTWFILGPFPQPWGGAPLEDAMRAQHPFAESGTEDAIATGVQPIVGDPWLFWVDDDDGISFDEVWRPGDGTDNVDDAYAYAVAYVGYDGRQGADLPITIGASSDDSILVRWNGGEVLIRSELGPWGEPAGVQVRGDATLHQGMNVLMAKVFEGTGEFGFRLRLEERGTGRPVTANDGISVHEAFGAPILKVTSLRDRILPGESETFQATVIGVADPQVRWDMNGADGLTVDAVGPAVSHSFAASEAPPDRTFVVTASFLISPGPDLPPLHASVEKRIVLGSLEVSEGFNSMPWDQSLWLDEPFHLAHALDGAKLEVSRGALRMSLPRGGDFNSWVDLDHAPKLLLPVAPFSNWAVETRITEVSRNPGNTLHAGLVAILDETGHVPRPGYLFYGINRDEIRLERVGAAVEPFEQPQEWVAAGGPPYTVSLLLEKRGTEYSFFYRLSDAAPWCLQLVREYGSSARQIGIFAKNWGLAGGEFSFDFLRSTSELPPAPEDLAAVQVDPTTIRLTWEDPAPTYDRIEVLRDGAWVASELPGWTTSFDDDISGLPWEDPEWSRTVAYEVRGFKGPAFGSASVIVQVDGSPEVEVSPLSLAFGSVLVGGTRSLGVTVRNLGMADLRITSIARTGSTDFSIAAGGGTPTIPAGGTHFVTIAYGPGGVGADTGTLTIRSNDVDEGTVMVSLTGTGVATPAPEIDVAPSVLEFGEVVAGGTRSLDVTVRNLGTADLRVTSIARTGSGDFSIATGGGTPTIPAGGTHVVTIAYGPGSVGADTGSLAIQSNDADEATVTVSLAGTGLTAPAPEIDVTPAVLDFGDVVAGSSRSLDVTVRNLGTVGLRIASIARTGSADFAIAAGGGTPTIPAGGTHAVTIAYGPGSVGADTGSLAIQSNDADESTITVSLRGRGVATPPSGPEDLVGRQVGSAIRLAWHSPVSFDRIEVWREEARIAELPGWATAFDDDVSDLLAENPDGLVAFEYRVLAFAGATVGEARTTAGAFRRGTFALQEGLFPLPTYEGTADAHILRRASGGGSALVHNTGANPLLEEGDWNGGHGDHKEVLLRFDLSELPAGSSIESAELRLHFESERHDPGDPDWDGPTEHFAYAHRVLKRWTEGRGLGIDGVEAEPGEVTWRWVRNGIETWDVDSTVWNGCDIPVAERGGAYGAADVDTVGAVRSREAYGTSGPRWVRWDVTTFVRNWMSDPATNRGIKITQNPGRNPCASYVAGGYDFASSENGAVRNRPILVLRGSFGEGPAVDRTPPGPQEIEASLAEGKARFSWSNPVPYDEIAVFRGTGDDREYLFTIPGDQTSVEILVPPGVDLLDLSLQGITSEAIESETVDASALRKACASIPALDNGAIVGEMDLSLFGDHLAASVTRCTPGGGGALSGGGAGFRVWGSDSPGMGAGITEYAIGHIVTHADLAVLADPNKLTTGFTLGVDADKLEISAHYQKIATDFGLSLRGRLIHVHPADGFVDEFSFPDTLIGLPKEKLSITYFRADRDPLDPGAIPCRKTDDSVLKIPAGEYLLDIYAVGGDGETPYYLVSDDARDQPLLIAGSPCPPYPWIEVRDLTGTATLPQVSGILADVKGGVGIEQLIGVTYTARGTWSDEANDLWTIHAPDATVLVPYKKNPDVEYFWKIHAPGGPYVKSSGDSNSVYLTVGSYGCYTVELVVRDKSCGNAKTFRQEIAIVPNPSECHAPFLNFTQITPDPGGIYAIVGLDPAPGQGSFAGTRPVGFTFLVTPPCACDPLVPPISCAAAVPSDFECRLAQLDPANPGSYLPIVTLVPRDKCQNVTGGPKFYELYHEDLAQLAPLPGADDRFVDVYFQARSTWVGDTWKNLGSPLHLTNPPESFLESYWSGHLDGSEEFSSTQVYHFTVTQAQGPVRKTPMPDSTRIEVDIPGGDSVDIPSYPNGLSSGFTARIRMEKGVWSADEGSGSALGQVLGNKLDGAPVKVKPQEIQSGTGGGDGAGGGLPAGYLWCDSKEIFKHSFSQKLFEAILYTGTVGPIPVTVWASIGIGLETSVLSQVSVSVSPFGPLDGGKFVESHFYLLSSIDLFMPCEIRADILFGVASLAARLIPTASFRLDTHVGCRDTAPEIDVYIAAVFSLYFEVEACLFQALCYTLGPYKLLEEDIIPPQGTDFRSGVKGCGAGGSLAGEEFTLGGLGEGGAWPATFSKSSPLTVVSPDGQTAIDCWPMPDGTMKVVVNQQPRTIPQFPANPTLPQLRDPRAAFLSNGEALIAWTSSFYYMADGYPFPPPATIAEEVLQTNATLAQEEIALFPVTAAGSWAIGTGFLLFDAMGGANGHADGKAAIAADLSLGEALVAWVRYEVPGMLAIDGTKTLPVPETDTAGNDILVEKTVPNVRPLLEQTAIYVRRASISGVKGPARRISSANPGINIEPDIAVSPSGSTAVCVWVNDPTHVDLIGSNRGRRLLSSVYSKASDSWGAPVSVLADPNGYDAKYPGILEPEIALKGDGEGLLVFTALPVGASLRDTGLGGSRLVYASRLQGGIFGEPFLIHEKCQKRVYGSWAGVIQPPDTQVDPGTGLRKPMPEWFVAIHGSGPIMSRAGAGDVLISTLNPGSLAGTPPVNLTPDDHGHSNISVAVGPAGIRTIHWDRGPAKLNRTGGGAADPPGFVVIDAPLDPDPAVFACELSPPFASPGSPILARVSVENLGLAGTPIDGGGQSAVRVRIIFVDDAGGTREVDSRVVPPLAPGMAVVVEVPLEMPHEPVLVRALLDPSPLDRDLGNNFRQSFLGAPMPEGVGCGPVVLRDEAERIAARLTWSNPALYDEVLVYRDGAMLSALPGGSSSFVDLEAGPVVHDYSLRGRIGPSKSTRATCSIDLATRPPAPRFDLSLRGPASLEGTEGETATTILAVALETRDLPANGPGAQAWRLSLRAEGATIVGATTEGTAGAEVAQGGLRTNGFERTEVVPGGAVSEVVLSLSEPITLPPVGEPQDLLLLTLEGTLPDGCGDWTVSFTDGLVGSAGPVLNLVTYGGSLYRAAVEAKTLRACGSPSVDARFRRGDVDGNGILNITDPIVSLGYQFLGQGTPSCLKALDADDNGKIQITDPILTLGYLFLGGRAPVAPFPDCGLDPTGDDLSCRGQEGCP